MEQEFIKRNGQFTVNVGLCEAGVPVLGVVGVPAAEEPRTYFAVKGEGAFVEVSVISRLAVVAVSVVVGQAAGARYLLDGVCFAWQSCFNLILFFF